jgi:hypothetical protein
MGGAGANDPAVVAAFHRALWRDGLVVALLALGVLVVWQLSRRRQFRQALSTAGNPDRLDTPVSLEPPARRFLRVSFGLLWVFDGILQGQASIPLGMIPRVVRPAAAGSPAWIRAMVGSASAVWTSHPVTAAASAVWIQVGIGLWLLVGGRGMLSQWAGAASVVWGLVVWVLGEAFGSIFAPGLSWMFGAPGPVLFYVAAGALIVLPESVWASPAPGRWLLRALGVFFVGMAALQAWPGRGYWQGSNHPGRVAGSLNRMLAAMAATPQPHLLASAVRLFADFDGAHGWAVNLFVVVALFAVGSALVSNRHDLVGAGVIGALVLCAADWLLVQDLGFMGGTGTDPNSMVPMALLLISGHMARVPRPAIPDLPGWTVRLRSDPAYAVRASAAAAAMGVTVLGAVPMLLAAL